jgi:hypothetical protein
MCYLLVMMDRDENVETQFVVPLTFSKKLCAAEATFRAPAIGAGGAGSPALPIGPFCVH